DMDEEHLQMAIGEIDQSAEHGSWIERIGQPIVSQIPVASGREAVQEILVLIGVIKWGLGVCDRENNPGREQPDPNGGTSAHTAHATFHSRIVYDQIVRLIAEP